jgi:hypothetical protein
MYVMRPVVRNEASGLALDGHAFVHCCAVCCTVAMVASARKFSLRLLSCCGVLAASAVGVHGARAWPRVCPERLAAIEYVACGAAGASRVWP